MSGNRDMGWAFGFGISLAAAVTFGLWDGRQFTVPAANAAAVSLTLPAHLNQLSDSTIHLVQDNQDDFQVKDASGPAGTAIPIQIHLPLDVVSPSDASAKYTFLMFRNIPDGFKLSSGFVTKNAHIVSIAQYKNISIIPPDSFRGKFSIRVLLYKGNNIPPVERLVNVSVGVSDTQTGDVTSPSSTFNTSTLSNPAEEELNKISKPKITPENEASSLAQGQQFIESGNIVYARLIYEDLAIQGSARGAFALGQTYDPKFLTEMNVVGLQPDMDAAKKWYQKAAKMGSQSATKRLNAINEEGL